MKKLIFVCLGNICRSPMAEFVMKDLLEKSAQTAQYQVMSRATSSWEHGNPVHPGTQQILAQHGIAIDKNKKSQQITSRDFETADQIIAMDDKNFRDLQNLAPKNTQQKVRMLLDQSVPDPWYTGDFEETYRLVKTGCEQLLTELQA